MNPLCVRRMRRIAMSLVPLLCTGAGAQTADAVPPFDVAYRAWDAVTDMARYNRNPGISGECGKTFRPFVSPGLRSQTKPEQDRAAIACHDAARLICKDSALRRTAEMTAKCAEFH